MLLALLRIVYVFRISCLEGATELSVVKETQTDEFRVVEWHQMSGA
jgi:hypothetical protein